MLQEVETHEQNKLTVLACSVPGYHFYWLEILFETKNKINKIKFSYLPTLNFLGSATADPLCLGFAGGMPKFPKNFIAHATAEVSFCSFSSRQTLSL